MTARRKRDFSLFGDAHVERYLATAGEVGAIWNGVPCLVLWTTGRRSGRLVAKPLIYGRDGDALVVVASKGGSPSHPAWYRNLQANDEVEVQVGAERYRARAHTAGGERRAQLWRAMAVIWPEYDAYQAKTDREIPVVVIERA